jgi:flagellar motor switch protein FliN/FliY
MNSTSPTPEKAPEQQVSQQKATERRSYSLAVLAIQTPVSVTLAHKKCSLERIIDLVPGAMLTFDAHCDEPLTLEAGGKAIASGEAVKIGDKFGLRIREVLFSGKTQNR